MDGQIIPIDRFYFYEHFDILFVIFGQVFKEILNLQVLIRFLPFIYFSEKLAEAFSTAGLATPRH